jgi:hypothetical protein
MVVYMVAKMAGRVNRVVSARASNYPESSLDLGNDATFWVANEGHRLVTASIWRWKRPRGERAALSRGHDTREN